ncbi:MULTISPECIES: metal ABC transporter solute-binding protein, Zn/Mn family [Campylobacter]|uniref:metal ABC transporter solute-binding protein, Zn/Mn family n=1 Tax=Campylobacter TaxID=194 RepID=UPI0014767228|nr:MULTISPECIES: zinc ABC transporter substrate-binding protein [unclassified Campylobacter]MBE3021701.1 zinc ABC transporter substrate-binding protein [Campylobacter sp. 7477a]MBE3610225.1 zinc ABC transporter substrate-binding protein [Campylobacter sp. RM12916]
MKKIFTFLMLSAIALFAKPIVTASILPTKYFIEQIAQDTVTVNVMVSKGADPHTYEPKPKQMQELEKSEIYFAVGTEFEEVWLKRFTKTFKNLKIAHTDEGIKKISMVNEHEHHHEHGPHCDHDHGGLDPHIWLDPVLVKAQANNIAKVLLETFPQNKELYEQNLAKFQAKLDALDKKISDLLKDTKNRKFIVYHPSWGYFAHRYDLEQIAIEIEGKEPKPAQIAELIEEAKEHNVKVIFVAPQFSQKAAKLIASQINANVVSIDQLPLEWEEEMKKTAEILAKSL